MVRFRKDTFETFGLGGSGGTFMHLEKDASTALLAIAEGYPRLFARALRHLGFTLRGALKSAMRAGGPKGHAWEERSRMHIYRRLDWLKSTGTSWRGTSRGKMSLRRGGGASRSYRGQEKMMSRWRSGGGGADMRSRLPMSRLVNAIRYTMPDQTRVDIGAVDRTPAMYIAAVQGAQRGRLGVFEHSGRQFITPRMRRMFWAAGIPLKKGKSMLNQPARPLLYPVYRQMEPEILPRIEARIKQYLAGFDDEKGVHHGA